MAEPTAPTRATLIDKALKLAGYASPTAALVTLAEGWMETIKSELALKLPNGKAKSLIAFSSLVVSQGRARYALPTDVSFYGDIGMKLVWGTVTGAAAAGGAGTVTLAAGDTPTLGQFILMTSGNSSGGYSQITAIVGQQCTITPSFETDAAASDNYMLIASDYLLERRNYATYMFVSDPDTQGQPKHYYPYEDENDGEFILDPTPDGTYGVPYSYYDNLQTLDLAGTKISTLYHKYEAWWIKSIQAYALKNDDDNRWEATMNQADKMAEMIVAQESIGTN
jgi:hypothetical protein